MPRLKLTKSAIDVLPTPAKDVVYWDSGCPGFGVKITPKGRKVFIVLYRAGGAGSKRPARPSSAAARSGQRTKSDANENRLAKKRHHWSLD